MKTQFHKQAEILEHITDGVVDVCMGRRVLDAGHGDALQGLHQQLFNEDYYIIGTYKAKQWLGYQAFDCIAAVREYETDNFGEVTTDLTDPEKVVNMYVYIAGEALLSEIGEEVLSTLISEGRWKSEESCGHVVSKVVFSIN